jgi:hypothetical protein
MLMHRHLHAIAGLGLVVAVALPVPAAAQTPNWPKVGTLTCDISAGIGIIVTSKKNLICMFTPSQPGPREVYTGSITKYGLDLATSAGGEMIWAVYAPSNKRFGALSGHYGGASAEATVGAGANALVGGTDRTVTLQPVSLQAQSDLNVAAGVAEIDLRPAR